MIESELSSAYGDVLLSWHEHEHDPFVLGPKSRLITLAILLVIIAWALYTNSPLMAITFVLIGVIGYLLERQVPAEVDFFLTDRGVLSGNNFYPYEALESFHIYEDGPFADTLSLHTNGDLISHHHIPLTTVDNQAVYDILVQFVPEIPHEPNFLDTVEKMMHI
jgi:hypothetical protein